MHRKLHDPLSGEYLLKCSEEDCEGQTIVRMNFGVNWAVGQRIPMDPTEPGRARCPLCLRHNMTVASAPPEPKAPPPKGFRRIPTE